MRLSSRDGTVTMLQQPLSSLYPLEISSPHVSSARGDSAVDYQQAGAQVSADQLLDMPQGAPPVCRSTRAAASKAIDWVKGWIAALDGDDDDDDFVDQQVNGGRI